MPVLPFHYNSIYYVVELNYADFLNDFYNFQVNDPQPAKIFASKFTVEQSNQAQKKLLIQGKPGSLAHDISVPVYTYTIEAPLITTNAFTNTRHLPYNSLSFIAMPWLNLQWRQMNLGSNNDCYAVLVSFEIKTTADSSIQVLKIMSNKLLASNNENGLQIIALTQLEMANRSEFGNQLPYNVDFNVAGRLIKNYDVAVDMSINVESGSEYSLLWGSNAYANFDFSIGNFESSPQPVYISGSTFSVEFEFDKKVYINSVGFNTGEPKLFVDDITGAKPATTFIYKDYNIKQSYTIIGPEAITIPNNHNLNEFQIKTASNVMSIADVVLYYFVAPFVVASKTEDLESGELIKTTLDFSFNGVTYTHNSTDNILIPAPNLYGLEYPPKIGGVNALIGSQLA
jgi:hypothetical protein